MSLSSTQISHCEPRNFIQPCLLLLLGERADHGYDLMERLHQLGAADADTTAVYRTLRALERDALVRAQWTPSSQGPPRKTYQLTARGQAALREWAEHLEEVGAQLERYRSRYGALLTSTREAARSRPLDAATAQARRGSRPALGASVGLRVGLGRR